MGTRCPCIWSNYGISGGVGTLVFCKSRHKGDGVGSRMTIDVGG